MSMAMASESCGSVGMGACMAMASPVQSGPQKPDFQ